MSRPSLSTRIMRVWRQGGIPAVGRTIAGRAWRSNSAIWHERDLTSDLATLEARVPIRVVLGDPRGTLDWLRSRPHDPRELSLALAAAHLLARAELDQTPIAYVKAGWGEVWVSDFQASIRFPKDAAFIYDSYVDPATRRRGVASALIVSVLRDLQGRGFRRVFCHIPEHNLASRHLYQSLGFVARRKIAFARVLGVPIVRPHPRSLWSHST